MFKPWGVLAAAVCLVLVVAPAPAREMAAHGDILFFLDTAAFKGSEGRVLEEVNIRIPNNELKFVRHDDVFISRVRLTVLVSDMTGTHVIEDAQELEFVEEDAARTETSVFFQTVIKRYQLDPGVYQLSYAVEDQQAQRQSISGIFQRKNKISVIRNVRLSLPGFPDGEPSFSEAKFVWSVDHVGDRVEYHPNPSRLYGLYKDSVFVYMELYLPDSMARSPEFEFGSQISNAEGKEVVGKRVSLPNPSTADTRSGGLRAYPVLIHEDLSRVVAGVYTLWVSFGLEGRLLRRVRCGDFSVAWDMRTWEVPRRQYLAEARFLLGDDDFEDFALLDPGEQESRLDAMWKTHDPTPETAENEAYAEFLVRLAYINQHYSQPGEPAIVVPRGQIYMRFGPPDEMIIDVIPINRETVSEAIEMVGDRYHSFNFSSHGAKPYRGQTQPNVIADPRGLAKQREGDNVAYPFELWIYEAGGKPILQRDRGQEMDISTRYLFVDRFGHGRYRLESSSSISNK